MKTKHHKTALTLLSLLTASTLLVACGQPNEESNTKSPQTSQISKETQKKTDTSSKEKTPDNKNSEPNTDTEDSKDKEDSPVSDEKPVENDATTTSIVPDALVGRFEGDNQQATNINLNIRADGSVSSAAIFDGQGRTAYATISEVTDLGNGFYAITYTGDPGAIWPGVSGIGGAGFVMIQGVKLIDGQLTPVGWSGPDYDSVDYNNPTEFGFSLTKVN